MARRFRNIFRWLLPSWLTGDPDGDPDDGGRALYVFGVMVDASIERLHQGIASRFPTNAGTEALRELGADRGIPRGRDETADHYRARLRAWRYPRGHRIRGGAPALLEQVSEYFDIMRAWTIDKAGNRYTRAVDGTIAVLHGQAWNWDGEALLPLFAKFWLVLTPNPDLPSIKAWPTFGEGTWGGGTFGEAEAAGYTVGHQGISYQDARAIKRLFQGKHPWKPANAIPVYAVVQLDDYTTASDPAPDGSWGSAAGRDPALRYWNLGDF